VEHGLEEEPPRPQPPADVVRSSWATVRSSEFKGEVQMRFDVLADGQFVLRQVLMDSEQPITSAVLADIPISEVRELIARPVRDTDDQRLGGLAELQAKLLRDIGLSDDEIELLARTPQAVATPRRIGREGPTLDDLELFAACYRIASAFFPDRVIAATMENLKHRGIEISRATANRWRTLAQTTDPPLLPGGKLPSLTRRRANGNEPGQPDE
jgi:hypothetical protein